VYTSRWPNLRTLSSTKNSGTVEIGAGLTWAEVYEYLVPKGINVVGGRCDTVGVSSLTLGGGDHL